MSMSNPVLATFVLLASLIPSAFAQNATDVKPLLKQNERDALAPLFGEYFRLRAEDKDIKAMQKALDKAVNEMEKRSKALKLASLLESPVDMRWVMNGPTAPDKSARKGIFIESTAEIQLSSGTTAYPYLYRAPRNYSEKSLYPTIIALAPRLDNASAIKKWAEANFPEAIAETAIIVVPMNLKKLDWTTLDGLQTAMFPLRDGMRRLGVDRSRIFLDGSADSAPAAAQVATLYPGFFAGVVLRAPAAAPPTALLANVRHIPMLSLIAGKADGTPAQQFVQDAEAAGVKVNVVDGLAETGTLSDAGSAAISSFLADSKKMFAPREIKFTTTARSSNNCYWLALTEFEASESKPVTVEGIVDRTKNEITITAPASVKQMKVFLNQDLVDMGKRLKILVRKKADDAEPALRYDGTLSNNFDRAMSAWFNNDSGNNGEVYTNFVLFSTSGK